MKNNNVASKIENIIRENLSPHVLEVINESHLHAGHAGDNGTGESHFKLIVVSGVFDGKTRIERHRMIYGLLGDLMQNPIHALSINAKTPVENT